MADVIEGKNIRMVQSRSRTCFAAETFQRLLIFRHIFREKFQRDEAAELGVLGFIHNTHTATADFFDNAIV